MRRKLEGVLVTMSSRGMSNVWRPTLRHRLLFPPRFLLRVNQMQDRYVYPPHPSRLSRAHGND